MTAFFDSQLKYNPLIWIRHSSSNNSTNDRLHERCLEFIYKDKVSSNFSPSYINEIIEVRKENLYNPRQNF